MNLYKAQTLANQLLEQHGLKQKGWRFFFDNAKRRFGSCQYHCNAITLSKHLTELNEENEVRNTILHEIAHALTPGHGHNSVWRRKAIEIGCNGERCYNSKDVETPESKYVAVCSSCNNIFKRHRTPKGSSSCGRCSGGRYNPAYKLEFKINPKFSR